ncbi:DUF2200 domain-containing protein [Sphingomicrobium lutaoense]|uniref:DUF2200 domain-containing protein n=1 Tax=Sphingomicrobium lutaoense TaxID=515949 RepID=A0A839YZL6_9SPHN|nr:DUF2200 domain-containing protein [Sphingomicrobium lutaoense]MBB3764436.1 hypothetical protein [Sphingomicrobium lutaoense]
MPRKSIGEYEISQIYPLYIEKVEKKGQTKEDLDRVIKWLTGHDDAGLARQIESSVTLETFFDEAPQIHENADQVKGVICGIRVEEIEDPLVRNIRRLDKLVDELARGKALDKILR